MSISSLQEEVQETRQNSSANYLQKIPLLSFFAGAGFLDIGFMQAGFDIIWRNEYNPSFVKGFEYAMANMPNLNHHNNGKVNSACSVTDLTAKQIAQEAFHNLPSPEMFGIIGGPPCPDFARGGKNRGREGDHGRLSQTYIDIIVKLQPSFFLFENVPGLLRTKKHRQFLYELMSQLLENYYIDLSVLNALEYGIPQDRERLFLIGFLKKWAEQHMDPHLLVKCQNWEKGLFPNSNINDFKPLESEHWFPWPTHCYEQAKMLYSWPEQSPFGAEPEKPVGIPDELMIGSVISEVEKIAKLPNGLEGFEPRSEKFNTIAEGDVSRKSFKRLHRWRYSPAAAYGNNEVHLHPALPRRLTVREALRIQTVPDSYAFPEEISLSHKFKMIGNGVPVKLAYVIAVSFADFLISHG